MQGFLCVEVLLFATGRLTWITKSLHCKIPRYILAEEYKIDTRGEVKNSAYSELEIVVYRASKLTSHLYQI